MDTLVLVLLQSIALCILLDTDECAKSESNNCGPNALCTNTEGSYVCRCLRGYKGDGSNCTGEGTILHLNRFIGSFYVSTLFILQSTIVRIANFLQSEQEINKDDDTKNMEYVN